MMRSELQTRGRGRLGSGLTIQLPCVGVFITYLLVPIHSVYNPGTPLAVGVFGRL